MSGEERAIAATTAPVTRAALGEDLARLGVRRDGVLLVHSSLSALGWVCGGAQAVVEALLDALGPEGTLVVPTHTGGYSDPSTWRFPAVPEAWWPVIRETMPAFDPDVTPARGLGLVVEVARSRPGALRSAHPMVSFAAVGPQAAAVTADHALDGATRIGRVGAGEARLMRQRELVAFAVGWLREHRPAR
jgi:aminoglycoside 3-N-acetyltransferase